MARRQDIAIMNDDLVFVDGDIAIAYSDEQHIQDTVCAAPGSWKEFPSDGVGLFKYLNSSGQEQALSRSIKIQLQVDGYQANNPQVEISNGKMTINPNVANV
jgi:hypothetical protein